MSDFSNLLINGIARSGEREGIGRDEIDGLIVSTVRTMDMGPETAIVDRDGAHPVERYSTDDAAQAGHAKWCQFVRDGHRDIRKLGYGDLVDPLDMTLRP